MDHSRVIAHYSEPPWLLDFLPIWAQVTLGAVVCAGGVAILCWAYSHSWREAELGALLAAASSLWIVAGLAAMLHPLS
jgi:hypothetical protein